MRVKNKGCQRVWADLYGFRAGRAVGSSLIALALGVFPAAGAFAQSSTNVAAQAVDAFGEKVGSEQIGLYSEQQVRGFSLQDSGNYRLDRAYFIRSANIVGASLEGSTIRVGINALGIDFPAPSGIVEFRLAEAEPGAREEIEVALRDYGGQAYFLRGSAATQDGEFGAAYGISIMNDVGSDGQKRYPRHYAIVPTWKPNDKFQLRGLFSADRFSKPGGNYGILFDGTSLPDELPHPRTYYADWGRISQLQLAGGLVARYAPTDRISLQSSVVVTDLDRWRDDFTRLSLDATGAGTATVFRNRPSGARSTAVETRGHFWVTDTQRLYGTLRWRTTRNIFRPGEAVSLGPVDLDNGVPVTPEPDLLTEADPTRDETEQVTGGLGYEAQITDSIWVRGAVLKTHYKKDVRPPGLPAQSNVDTPWLYDFAATYTPLPDLTLFATTVRGLEESGTAPNNAANRNEVLPAVIATQYELGMRYRITPAVTFIGSVFEVAKPTPGIDSNNVFRIIGKARHRGIELSLVGRPIPSVNIVSGLVLLDADRRGELIDQGVLIGRATGVSSVTGLLNATYEIPFVEGLSIDGQLNYNSKSLLNPRTGLYTPGHATLDIGARYTFEVAGVTATLRARVGNVFNENAWTANRNETVERVDRRAFRLSLTTSLGH